MWVNQNPKKFECPNITHPASISQGIRGSWVFGSGRKDSERGREVLGCYFEFYPGFHRTPSRDDITFSRPK